MQRGYDQLAHDVVIQSLPVRFVLDRAGLVGNDGPTHHGSFDLTHLGCMPNLVICAPSDEIELMNLLTTIYGIDDKPSCIRYPRGNGYGVEKLNELYDEQFESLPEMGFAVPVGKGRVVRRGRTGRVANKVAILALGTRLAVAAEAAIALELEHPDVSVTVADARFMKPPDVDLVRHLANDNDILITMEENSVLGFGDYVLHFLALEGLLDNGGLKFRPMCLPDSFIETATQMQQYEEAGLNTKHVIGTVNRLLDRALVPAI